jgi:PepSY-associated TM region
VTGKDEIIVAGTGDTGRARGDGTMPRIATRRITMSLSARFFRWHRWVGYLVAIQVLAWVLGGLLFAWLPFQPWIKGADVLARPQQALPADWPRAVTGMASGRGPLLSVHSVATASGPALKLLDAQGEQWLSATGGELPSPDAGAVGRYARTLYRGDGALQSVQQLQAVPRRMGIVRELGERSEVWLAQFDDRLRTRLYFDVRSGELLALRNDAWVLYDFFWRLHVMDYEGGEDFNNALLRGASIVALGLVLTGLTLMGLALRRAWRRRS